MRKFRRTDYIASALLSFIPKVIMILTASFPLRVTGDELFMFYLPAKLAGLDWSECMYNYRYYGYGFNIFLTPLFKYITDPIVLYRCILIIVAALQMIIPIICCYLLRNCYKSTNIASNIIISLICTYMVVVYPTYMYSEHIYIICVWFSFYCLYRLINNPDDKKRKLIYSFIIGFLFIISLTIHQRAITLFYAFVIVCTIYAVLFRRKLAYIIPVSVVYFAGAYLDKKLVAWNVSYLKESITSLSEIENTNTNFEFSFLWFLDGDYTDAFFKTFIGNINNWNIFTLGFGSFTIVLGICLLVKCFKKKLETSEKQMLVMWLYSIFCIGITIFGLAITWGWGIRRAYMNHDATVDSLRGLAYLRYFMCYYPPILLGTLVYIINNRKKCFRFFKCASFFSVVCALIWLKHIVMPLLSNSAVGLGYLQPFSLTTFGATEISLNNYLFAFLIIGIIAFLSLHFLKRRTINGVLLILLCFVSYLYLYQTYWGDGKSMVYNISYSDGATKMLEELQDKNIATPIYVQASTVIPETQQTIIHQLQFMNMRTKLFRGLPSPDLEEAVYIAYYHIKEHDALLQQGYVQYQLDDNEYVYVKGDSLQAFFQEYAY